MKVFFMENFIFLQRFDFHFHLGIYFLHLFFLDSPPTALPLIKRGNSSLRMVSCI
jgi:hypothetical protein